ncbi:MAG: class I SAM-dependent methyltransferase [Candidatus Ranarchaeia archaeon]
MNKVGRTQKAATKQKLSVTRAFNQTANVYDEWFSSQEGKYFFDVEATGLQKIGETNTPAHGIAVDIGSGTQIFVDYLQRKAHHVIGIELSPKMQEIARRRRVLDDLKRFSRENILADAHMLPLRDKTVEHIFFLTSLEFLTSPETVLLETKRISRFAPRKTCLGIMSLNLLSLLGIFRRIMSYLHSDVYSWANSWTPKGLLQLLSKMQLQTHKWHGAGFLPPFGKKWFLPLIRKHEKKWSNNTILRWFGGVIFVTATYNKT